MIRTLAAIFVILAATSCAPARPQDRAQAAITADTQYLAFQVFTGSPRTDIPPGGTVELDGVPPAAELDRFAATLVSRIGETGTPGRRLALIFGPVAFDQTDAQVAGLIASAFDIALARDVAVGFHLDDSMYWGRRGDLLADSRNFERPDWAGPLSTGRRLDWGPEPSRAPPQMCINSPTVEAEVQRRGAQVIGAAIHAGLERLRRAGREDLFAGVIVGWETQIGADFETGRTLGYCALANRGVGPGATPATMDDERTAAVAHFIALWAQSVASAGVPTSRIYSHVAFVPRRIFEGAASDDPSYARRTIFAPPETAFGPGWRAGFSTYPQPGLFDELHQLTAASPWASVEGANLALGGEPGASGMTTETYLARLFNHGAALVNVFGWGVGPAGNPFRKAAEGAEAVAAYRKFLRGAPLVEGVVTATLQERLPPKIRRIQAELPAWIRRHNGQARAQPHIEALDAAITAQDFARADKEADALLALMAGD